MNIVEAKDVIFKLLKSRGIFAIDFTEIKLWRTWVCCMLWWLSTFSGIAMEGKPYQHGIWFQFSMEYTNQFHSAETHMS